MSYQQYSNGNYSGGWLYAGMATRIGFDIGLHRKDAHTVDPEQAEIMKRVWWVLYMSDRIGSCVLGRPVSIVDENFNVDRPSTDWISKVIAGDDTDQSFESERLISCRLLWYSKLFTLMGKVLNTMYCVEVELSDTFLADLSKIQLPHLHNGLTTWFSSLPAELQYTPYAMSPGTDHPPPSSTALMHMMYYSCLTMVHRPYMYLSAPANIRADLLNSSRTICTTAAINVCHIAGSLKVNGQLRNAGYYGLGCLFAAGTIHMYNIVFTTPNNRETALSALTKIIEAARELAKTFPVAELYIAMVLDVVNNQEILFQKETSESSLDTPAITAPFSNLMSEQPTTSHNTTETSLSHEIRISGSDPAPTMQLRHPYGRYSLSLPDITMDQNPSELSKLWQTHVTATVGMIAKVLESSDPQIDRQPGCNPLDISGALQQAPTTSIYPCTDPTATSTAIPSDVDYDRRYRY
ncbi:hypothetical protein BGX27_001875 [Mortierella sp. AM989]|nr:hypothetical protein BGX27_001875 [Mortierella sp. AM989]